MYIILGAVFSRVQLFPVVMKYFLLPQFDFCFFAVRSRLSLHASFKSKPGCLTQSLKAKSDFWDLDFTVLLCHLGKENWEQE